MITPGKSANTTVSRSKTISITTVIISYSDLKRNDKKMGRFTECYVLCLIVLSVLEFSVVLLLFFSSSDLCK